MTGGNTRFWDGVVKRHLNSDVRHPRCVSYNGKELRVEYAQSNTTILTTIINIMRVPTTTCFGPTCGPSSGCKV